MDNDLKIFFLQFRIKELERLLIQIEKNNGHLAEIIKDLNSPNTTTRWHAKYSLLSRGIGIQQFCHDEDDNIRHNAERLLELRQNKDPKTTAYLNEIDFHLDTKEDSQIVDITHSMFPQQYGGFNG